MNTMETAKADLQEADKALKAYVSKETLENNVRIAEQAVLAAARGGPRPSETMLDELEAEDAAASFSEDTPEIDQGDQGSDLSVETDDEIFEESNLKEVSATAADVVDAINDALPSEPDTIDATDEVSVEEVVAVRKHPNGHLGENYDPYR
ncbi:MAG: hypothetical protein AAFP81_00905 [Pseudomonadota bacterium]